MNIHFNLFELLPISMKRWVYLTFKRKKCVKFLIADKYFFKYGDLVTIKPSNTEEVNMLSIGKGWMFILKKE
jgi:hypothetical protein